MLKLCAAQLSQYYPCRFSDNFQVGRQGETVNDPSNLPSPPLSPSFLAGEDKRFAWIDVGGGTGENIERMNEYFPIANFDRVYLVDITPSLCEIARKRFAALGWSNVTVLCTDASTFAVPAEDGADLDIALITMSYSLTMIETFYPLIDRLTQVLSPSGIFGVADFYVSSKRSSDPTRQLPWLTRWFWAVWFDQDNVYLTPGRREYLEHKFQTVKSRSARNNMLPLVHIPYYIWIGAQKESKVQMPMFSLDGNLDDMENDSDSDNEQPVEPIANMKSKAVQHLVSSDHVHGQGVRWRMPFDPALLDRFSTYIYAFAWEDPRVDLEYLNLTAADRMFVITSGGCNVLEYAIKVGPERIHSVDLNPCQNHMLELKLAALSSLVYEDYWKLFGQGYIEQFSTVLDTHLSPHLSPYAYHFWKETSGFKSLFKTGCSGLAVRVFQFVIRVRGLREAVDRMCNAETLEEQVKIWREKLRPHLLSKWLVRILNNDRFLWGALGVPPAQMQMLLSEGTAQQYMIDTLDPVFETSHLRDDNYFYYMPLMLKYSPLAAGNPAYLSEAGYDVLRSEPHRLDAIKIHTDYINNVLNDQVSDGELTCVILMDHLDWFSRQDCLQELELVYAKMAKSGRVFWRSAGKCPWYNDLFEQVGFTIKACQIRQGDTMLIDRVNMYKSHWQGVKE